MKITTGLIFCVILASCSDDARVDMSTEGYSEINAGPAQKPSQPEGSYTVDLFKQIFPLDNDKQSRQYRAPFAELRVVHIRQLPALSPQNDRQYKVISSPSDFSDQWRDRVSDHGISTTNWSLCSSTTEQPYQDDDYDRVPKKLVGTTECKIPSKEKIDAVSPEIIESSHFQVEDLDDHNWKSGYSQNTQLKQKGRIMGETHYPEFYTIPITKIGWEKFIEEKSQVTQKDADYSIHVEREDKSTSGEGTKLYYWYSLDLVIAPVEDQITDKNGESYSALSHHGIIKSMSGLLQILQEGQFFTFRVTSTALSYSEEKEPKRSCKDAVLSSGTITLTDGANNKIDIQFNKKPTETIKDETDPQCFVKSFFNDKEIGNLIFFQWL